MTKTELKTGIDKINEIEISAVKSQDKISKLEKERDKNKKAIEEYKEREKSSARALVIYERKIKYLKQKTIEELLNVCKKVESNSRQYLDTCESIMNFETKQSFKAYKEKFDDIANSLYALCDIIEQNSGITNQDRAFISNRPIEHQNAPAKNDINSRFDRLKQEFSEKVGDSVSRKPGRPKKQDQSIIADIGLGKKLKDSTKKEVKADDNAQKQLDKIFYETPKNTSVMSNILSTDDSLFDFNEALNPNISLKDIMADLMEEKQEEPVKTYSKISPKTEKKVENSFDSAQERKSRIEMLEAGIFQIPRFKTKEQDEEKSNAPHQSFEDRFMPFKNIMDETKE